jgi:hypothetical protein
LRCDNGVIVDSLRTSQHSIFAAGDVASFVTVALGRRIRAGTRTMYWRWGSKPAAIWPAQMSHTHRPTSILPLRT